MRDAGASPRHRARVGWRSRGAWSRVACVMWGVVTVMVMVILVVDGAQSSSSSTSSSGESTSTEASSSSSESSSAGRGFGAGAGALRSDVPPRRSRPDDDADVETSAEVSRSPSDDGRGSGSSSEGDDDALFLERRSRAIADVLAEESVDDRRRAARSSASRNAVVKARRSAARWLSAYVADEYADDGGDDGRGHRHQRRRGSEDAEAWRALGLARRYGLVDGDMNERLAMECFAKAAARGDVVAHEELGFAYASGWDGTPRDAARSVLHYYFAANGGSVTASMALGYRHKHGFDVPESCETAVMYYHEAAKLVVDEAAKRTPGMLPFQIEKHRLSAEMAGSNIAARRERDLVQYYRYSADMGNVDAQVTMGRLYSLGARGLPKDIDVARKYLEDAANAGDANAMAHLGHMYANGFGVRADNATALRWFSDSASKGNAMGRYGLGYMTLAGHGIEQNHATAVAYLNQAAEQGLADARFFLGVLSLRGIGTKQDLTKAYNHFNIASLAGHEVATYNLAMMQLNGMGFPSSCASASTLLKQLAERGTWVTPMEHAYAAYMRRDYRGALLRYMKMAEMGLEVAQANAAFLLEHKLGDGGRFREDTQVNPLASSTATRALHYHRLAATQGNVRSLLRIGDAYYYGRGAPVSLVKSVAAYRQASEQRNAHAMFNLAHMHEHGIGMQKDLHLAKRYYDMILTSSPEATMIVKIALHKLAIHRWIINHHDELLAFARELKENPTAQMVDFVILVGATSLLLFVMGLRVMLE